MKNSILLALISFSFNLFADSQVLTQLRVESVTVKEDVANGELKLNFDQTKRIKSLVQTFPDITQEYTLEQIQKEGKAILKRTEDGKHVLVELRLGGNFNPNAGGNVIVRYLNDGRPWTSDSEKYKEIPMVVEATDSGYSLETVDGRKASKLIFKAKRIRVFGEYGIDVLIQ